MKKNGLIHIYTGEGKGKTTAALGLSVRAAGHGMRVFFVQFFKEDSASSGERALLAGVSPAIEMVRSNCRHPMFTKEKTDPVKVKRSIEDTFNLVRKRVAGGGVDLLVLDEIMSAVKGGWVPLNDLIGLLDGRPPHIEVVLTGRDAPPELVAMADYVTEMLKIKHPFDAGVAARKGIEY